MEAADHGKTRYTGRNALKCAGCVRVSCVFSLSAAIAHSVPEYACTTAPSQTDLGDSVMLRLRNLAQQSAPEAETRRGRSPKSRAAVISVRALHAREGDKDIYAFFMSGCEINRIAHIVRVSRDESDTLRGVRRKEIRDHLRSMVPYLNSMDVRFPNAIALALSSEVCFIQSRGSAPPALATGAREGILSIPLRAEGERVGWLVDGQQRPLAAQPLTARTAWHTR